MNYSTEHYTTWAIAITSREVSTDQILAALPLIFPQHASWSWSAQKIKERTFRIRFPSTQAVIRALLPRTHELQHFNISFRIWRPHTGSISPTFSADRWVKIWGVPDQVWSYTDVQKLVSCLGILIDYPNLRYPPPPKPYLRACIRLFNLTPFPGSLYLSIGDHTFWCPIEIDQEGSLPVPPPQPITSDLSADEIPPSNPGRTVLNLAPQNPRKRPLPNPSAPSSSSNINRELIKNFGTDPRRGILGAAPCLLSIIKPPPPKPALASEKSHQHWKARRIAQESLMDPSSSEGTLSTLNAKVLNFDSSEEAGSSGGIITCWDSRLFDLTDQSAGTFSLTVSLRDRRTNITWTLTNIYGPSSASLKKDFWSELSLLGPSLSPTNWILCGDFNCTSSTLDRNLNHNAAKISKSFNSFINNFNLYDIPIEGSKFTWSNLQASPILVKLDRFLLCSSSWDLLPYSFCTSHPRYLSDHTPIQLSSERKKGPRKPFKLETSLLGNPQLDSLIRTSWMESSSLPIHLRLRKIKKQYKKWSRNNFKPIQVEKRNLLSEIQVLDQMEEHQGPLSLEDLASRRKAKSKLADILELEEKNWKSRSKAKWIKDGDKNTSYYHRVASMRQKLNFISKIKINDCEISSPPAIQEALMIYFKDQFSLHEPPSSPHINWTELDCPTLTPLQENALSSPFSLEEIHKAVWALPSDKSPGPDGLPINFYKHFWNLIKYDILITLDNFWNNNLDLSFLNFSFISLIPKCAGALELHDFRPISLQNSLMKIISRILADRIRGPLNLLIADCQSAYLRERSILDSFASAQEIIHSTKRLGTDGVLIKLDFAKAYDCISRSFLLQTLKARGFGPRWLKWISLILESSKSSVLVNGIPSKPFSIHRGLRQGDPLSAYLFILVTDTLSRLLTKAHNNNLIRSISLNPAPLNPLNISHLQYADDTIIFSKANPSSILVLKAIIHFFSLASGLQINLSKTKLLGLNITEQESSSLAELFGCTCASFPINYLGLPLRVSNLTRNDWNPLLAKLNSSLTSWKAQALSIPGRIVLLNSNLTALPVYFMSLFVLPSWLLLEIDKIRRNFLWSGSPSQPKKIHSVNWKSVCRPLCEGGLGIKNLKAFNISLLLKWWWKLIFAPSLWSSIIRSKYYTNRHPLDLKSNPSTPSPMWKGLLSLKNIFKANVKWSLGSGKCISFWHENWGPSLSLKAEFPSLFLHAIFPSSKVASNFNISSNLWTPKFAGPLSLPAFNENLKLTQLLSSFSIDASNDKPQCSWFPLEYSTRYAYQIMSTSGIQWSHSRIWKLQIPPKIKIFIWKILIGKLNTKDIILRRNFPVPDLTCVFCDQPESIDHLFLNCPSLLPLWRKCCSPLSAEPLPANVEFFWNEWFLSLSKPNQKLWNLWVPALSWAIWIERNNRCFSFSSTDTQSLLEAAQGMLVQWNPNGAV